MNNGDALLRDMNRKLLDMMDDYGDFPEDECGGLGRTVMAIFGVCYSLGQCTEYSNINRTYDKQIRDCKGLMTYIDKQGSFKPIPENNYESWIVGYHLTNAELRIQSALQRIFEVLVASEKKPRGGSDIIANHINTIFNKCPVCGEQKNFSRCCPGSFPIMQEYQTLCSEIDKEILTKEELFDSPKVSGGQSMRRIWLRANSFKHAIKPTGDPHTPERRMQDIIKSVECLLVFCKEFSMHRTQSARK